MTLNDILSIIARVLCVIFFSLFMLWSVADNPTDTAVILFVLFGLCVVCYANRDALDEWHEEQLAKNRR